MTAPNQLNELLEEAGLQDSAVEKLVDEYAAMQTRLVEEEYEEVGVHIGRFCEALVQILSVELKQELPTKVKVSEFAHNLRENVGSGEPDSIRYILSQMLLTAYTIRNNRDTVHIDLQNPVNRSDARTGVAVCSWMLAEITRVYGVDTEVDNPDEIADIINKLSKPHEEEPLKRLEESRYDIDKFAVRDALEGVIHLVEDDEDIRPGPDFEKYSPEQKLVAILLGRLAAYQLNYSPPNTSRRLIGCDEEWLSERSNVDKYQIGNSLEDLDFVFNQESENGYFVPGYRSEEAIQFLESTEE